jgi:hypothetical protein
MSYTGYVPFLCEYAGKLYKEKQREIRILEIGVLQGTTLFPLGCNLSSLEIPYKITGVEILLRTEVAELVERTLNLISNVELIEANSLNFLQTRVLNHKLASQEIAYWSEFDMPPPHALLDPDVFLYDIILIDGDHNYSTVSQECEYLKSLMHPHTILLFDDVDSKKHGHVDTFYADDDEYISNTLATPYAFTETVGVQTAVNEFQREKDDWVGYKLFAAPPRLIVHAENDLFFEFLHQALKDGTTAVETLKETVARNRRKESETTIVYGLDQALKSTYFSGEWNYPLIYAWFKERGIE